MRGELGKNRDFFGCFWCGVVEELGFDGMESFGYGC